MPANSRTRGDQQAITVCFAIEHLPGEDHTIDKPRQYELWREFRPAGWPGPLLSWTTVRPETDQPLTRLLFEAEDDHPWWRFRRILDRSNFEEGFARSDVSVVNWPQNDYWSGPVVGVDAAEQARHLEAARQLSLSLLYWLQTEAPRPDGGHGYPGLRLRGDVVGGTPDGLAPAPYVRESRRLRAEFTVLEQHIAYPLRTARPRAVRRLGGDRLLPDRPASQGQRSRLPRSRLLAIPDPARRDDPCAGREPAAGRKEPGRDPHHQRRVPGPPGRMEHRRGRRDTGRVLPGAEGHAEVGQESPRASRGVPAAAGTTRHRAFLAVTHTGVRHAMETSGKAAADRHLRLVRRHESGRRGDPGWDADPATGHRARRHHRLLTESRGHTRPAQRRTRRPGPVANPERDHPGGPETGSPGPRRGRNPLRQGSGNLPAGGLPRHELGIPVILYAISAGPLITQPSRQAVAEALNAAASTVITVRDRFGYRLLEDVGVTQPIHLTADPALLLEPEEPPRGCPGRGGRRTAVGIWSASPCESPAPPLPISTLTITTRCWRTRRTSWSNRYDADIVFVPMERTDVQHSHAVVAHMQNAERAEILRRRYSPRQILALMGRFDFAVGMRLHFLIFAALRGTPFAALPYATKVTGLLEDLEMETPPLGSISYRSAHRQHRSLLGHTRSDPGEDRSGDCRSSKAGQGRTNEFLVGLLEERWPERSQDGPAAPAGSVAPYQD